jgi:hypothetical protein
MFPLAERTALMPTVTKLDLYKKHKSEYTAPRTPILVNVPSVKYLTITGRGAPAGEEFQKAVSALYGVAYTIKMTKKSAGKDYKVCNLEGQWWGAQDSDDFWTHSPDSWNWRLMIRVPDFINANDLKDGDSKLKEKGKGDDVARVKLESITEGQCVQMLHVGPYAEEGTTIARMIEFAKENGLRCYDRHHEIYLSDPRRVPATRLRTILRHPVERIGP